MAKKPSFQVKPRSEMKTIDVIFVSDELVEEMILTRREYERQLQRKHKEDVKEINDEEEIVKPKKRKLEENNSTKYPKHDDLELALAALENVDVEKVPVVQPTTLFDEKADVTADKMFSFQARKSYAKSPISKTKAPVNNVTPKAKKSLDSIAEETNSQTPYKLRKRDFNDIKKIQKILENDDDDDHDFSPSGSEFSDDGSSADESEDEDEKKTAKKNKSYFDYHSSRKGSLGRSIKKLDGPKLTQEKINEIFKDLKLIEAHKPHLKQLFRNQLGMFEKWEYLLRYNYNILLYGVGSKRDIVERFLSRFTNQYPVITVNGFFPSVTIKDILEKVCEPLKLDSSQPCVLDNIEAKLNDYNLIFYVGINNIDGLMLRNKKTQQTLSRLAQISKIHLVATIDHINAPLMWDQCLLTDFNWAWFDGTTFLPYTEETIYEGNILLHPSGQLTLASLRSVFSSLTRNTRAIFLILARIHVSAEKGFNGVSFRELYHESRRQLLVSTDAALRLQLKEFIDHAILKQKRSPEGEEKYLITLDNSILKQFLEEQEPS